MLGIYLFYRVQRGKIIRFCISSGKICNFSWQTAKDLIDLLNGFADQIKNKLNRLQNMRNWPYQLDSIFCLTLTKYTFSLSSVFTKMFIKYRTGEENVWSSLPGSSTWMGSGKNDDI